MDSGFFSEGEQVDVLLRILNSILRLIFVEKTNQTQIIIQNRVL